MKITKKSVIQTIFNESSDIKELQDWANKFLLNKDAVNMQICELNNGNFQMLIVYKMEVEVIDECSDTNS